MLKRSDCLDRHGTTSYKLALYTHDNNARVKGVERVHGSSGLACDVRRLGVRSIDCFLAMVG